MAGKFLLSFFSIIAYMLFFAILFIPIMMVEGSDVFPYLIICWASGVFILYLPFFIYSTKLIWKFKSSNKKKFISEQDLKNKILEINKYNSPIIVSEKKNKLLVTWKYADAKWWEILSKKGLKKIYQLEIKFNSSKKRVTLIDVHKNVNWSIGPTHVKINGGYFRGIGAACEIGKAWGIKENFKLGKIYDYKFKNSEIKNPIFNTILRSGWDVEFGMY